MENSGLILLPEKVRNDLSLDRFQKGKLRTATGEEIIVAVKKINLKEQHFELYLNLVIRQSENENLLKMLSYKVDQANDALYLATELCEGNLKDYMNEKKEPLEENEAKEIFGMLLSGYEYLHDNYIIHRDIKPNNILYKTQNGRRVFKLADFGLSKPTEITQSLVGTTDYIAPEMRLDNLYDNRVDVWSMGVTFFEMISGAGSIKRIAAATSQDFINEDINRLERCSSGCKALLTHMLQVDFKRRITPEELFAFFDQKVGPQKLISLQPSTSLLRRRHRICFDSYTDGDQLPNRIYFDLFADGDKLPNSDYIFYSSNPEEGIISQKELNDSLMKKMEKESKLGKALYFCIFLLLPVEFMKAAALRFQNNVIGVFIWKLTLIYLEKLIILMKMGFNFQGWWTPDFHKTVIKDELYKKLLKFNTESYFNYQKWYWMEKTQNNSFELEPKLDDIKENLMKSCFTLELQFLSEPERVELLFEAFLLSGCVWIIQNFKLLNIPKRESQPGIINGMQSIKFKYQQYEAKLKCLKENGMSPKEREQFINELNEFTFSLLN